MKRIAPSRIEGVLRAPPSKSMMQRAALASCLARGTSQIVNPSWCDDGRASLRAAQAFGARVRASPEGVEVTGGAQPLSDAVECGESGLCLRMSAAIAALFDRETTLTASGSLRERPMTMIERPLSQLGALARCCGGKPPVLVRGPLRGGEAEIDGSVSSQLLSGLLLALPLCEDDSRLTVKGLKSAPYVRMTLQLLERFGITLNASPNLDRIEVMGRQSYRPAQISIEGDWSGAAFMLVAGALAGRATVQGLALDSTQPDRAIVDALRLAGAEVELRGDSVTAQRSGLLGFAFDATQCPDLFPPLVALAVGAQGETVLSGASRLRHKESDRARALVEEFRKMGARLDLRGDHLRVQGGSLEGGTVDAHGDHRIAMAVSIAGLVSRSGADLTGEGSVAKSYPDFFERLQALRVNP